MDLNRLLVAPRGLYIPELERKILKFKNLTAFESCTNVSETKSASMFPEDHLLLVVLKGFYNIKHNEQKYSVQKNEMVLLKKTISIEYEKSGDSLQHFVLCRKQHVFYFTLLKMNSDVKEMFFSLLVSRNNQWQI